MLRGLGVRGAVVHASSGIDEVDGEGPTTVYAFDGEAQTRWTLRPQDYGIDVPLAECAAEASTLAGALLNVFSRASVRPVQTWSL